MWYVLIVLIHCKVLRHQLQLCTRTPTAQWSLMWAGRVVQDRSWQQHRNGPVDRLYSWKEWNTLTVVDSSSTQALTFLLSSSHNVRSLPPRIEPLVLLWISKNPNGGFPENHLSISHDERDLTPPLARMCLRMLSPSPPHASVSLHKEYHIHPNCTNIMSSLIATYFTKNTLPHRSSFIFSYE